MTDETSDFEEGQPLPEPAGSPRRRRPRWSRGVRLGIGGAVAAVTVLVGGAVAVAVGSDDDTDDIHSANHASQSTDGSHDDHDPEAAAGQATSGDEAAPGADDAMGGMAGRGGIHAHEPLPPYEQRYGEASPEEQAAADELHAEVRTAIAVYEDVDAAVAAGYDGRRDTTAPLTHYLDRSVAEDGHVLDPNRPNGLVYYIGGEGDPVLVGAFFVALPGVEVPRPAGDLVVWHSHSPSCPDFFATDEDPCTESRRMLHVWTAEQIEVVRRTGRTVDMQVVDPFGAPFGAAVDPATQATS